MAAALVDACRPRTSLGCLFSDTEVASLRAWMASGSTRGPALALAGPGSGLTTLVTLLVAETGLEGVWVGCATPRVKAALAQAGSSPVAVTLRRKIIVVDEVDAMGSSGGETSSLAEALAFVKSKPPLPVLFLSHATRSQKPLEFAKGWPRFNFGRPGPAVLAPYLSAVAAKHGIAAATEDWVRDMAARARGDVRAALMAMDMLSRAAPAPAPALVDIKDDNIEGLDLTEAVLRGEAGRGVRECLRMYAMEPAVLPMGMWENYLSTLGKEDIGAVARAADGFADADRIDRFVYSRQAWDLMEAYGACAVAVPAMSLARWRKSRPPKTVSVTKFGSVWSKMYNACAKVKHLRALALAYAEAGAHPLSACELAWVRRCLQCAVKRGCDPDDLRRVCWPLAAPHVLYLARLDAGPGGSGWYTQAVHGRVKAALAAPPAPERS